MSSLDIAFCADYKECQLKKECKRAYTPELEKQAGEMGHPIWFCTFNENLENNCDWFLKKESEDK